MLEFFNLNNVLPLSGNEHVFNATLPSNSSSVWYYDDFTSYGHFVLDYHVIIGIVLFNIMYHIGVYYYNVKVKTWKKIEQNAHLYNALLNIDNSDERLSVPLLSKPDDEFKDNYGSTDANSEFERTKEAHFSIFHLKQDDDEAASYQVVVERSTFDYMRLCFDCWECSVPLLLLQKHISH